MRPRKLGEEWIHAYTAAFVDANSRTYSDGKPEPIIHIHRRAVAYANSITDSNVDPNSITPNV